MEEAATQEKASQVGDSLCRIAGTSDVHYCNQPLRVANACWRDEK